MVVSRRSLRVGLHQIDPVNASLIFVRSNFIELFLLAKILLFS